MIAKCRRTTQYSNGIVTGYFVGDPCFGKTAIIGRPRLKLRYRVLQNASKESPFNVYATVYHSDWQAVQDRFDFLGKEHRTEKGWIKTPAIVVGHKRIS